ncbi:MAG TPA: hypothetical protein VFA55_06140 [Candidatus Kapabacteria bacterium]|nr:hypothetical protein [Candidatus Kapabacteria bacterium]
MNDGTGADDPAAGTPPFRRLTAIWLIASSRGELLVFIVVL